MSFKLILCVILACCLPHMQGECKPKKTNTPALTPSARAKQTLLKNRTRTDLINYLITQRGYKKYLEVGIANGDNLKLIIAEYKIGVDPSPASPATYHVTSDDFFKSNRETFDIIFIDGLHISEQVVRDVENSLACLNPGGVIVMHDCLPATEQAQSRIPCPGAWNGDVSKAAAYIRMHAENVHFCVLDMDHGCGIVTPNSTQKLYPSYPIENMDWNYFVRNKVQLLNLISLDQWLARN